MRTALRYILDFLERRFPEKVVVTQEKYAALEEKVQYLAALEKRLSKTELDIENISMAMGYGKRPNGMVLER